MPQLVLQPVLWLGQTLLGKLLPVFPTEFAQAKELAEVPAVASDVVIKAKEKVEKPVVYIPVFPGTNSEYDSAKAFEKEEDVSLADVVNHSFN